MHLRSFFAQSQGFEALSHALRHGDPKRPERRGQSSPRYIRGHDQYRAFSLIFFGDYSMPVIEKVETPRQCKGILGKVRGLRRGVALRDHFVEPLCEHHQRPNLSSRLIGEDLRNFCTLTRRGARDDFFSPGDSISIQLAKDRIGTYRSILAIWPGLSFKRKGVLEVESDNRVARKLQQEIAQCPHRDLVGSRTLFFS